MVLPARSPNPDALIWRLIAGSRLPPFFVPDRPGVGSRHTLTAHFPRIFQPIIIFPARLHTRFDASRARLSLYDLMVISSFVVSNAEVAEAWKIMLCMLSFFHMHGLKADKCSMLEMVHSSESLLGTT